MLEDGADLKLMDQVLHLLLSFNLQTTFLIMAKQLMLRKIYGQMVLIMEELLNTI